jgi:sigma-B regulation protein RsbU (phosphoserine phosphatase)
MKNEKEAERSLRILHLEDSPMDAEIIRERLIDAGFSMEMDWASNEQEFTSYLQRGGYDLILADYLLPDFDAPAALLLTKSLSPGVPFIAVTGAVGEEKAVELLRQGATDYVLKDRLDRLPLAMKRALDEAGERKARRMAEETLQESERRFRELLASVTSYMYTVVVDRGRAVSTTHGPGCLSVTGFSTEEYAADPDLWYRMIHPADRQAVLEAAQHVLVSKSADTFEHRIQHKDGTIRWVQTTLVPNIGPEGQLLSYDGVITDITERKRAEEKILGINEELEQRVRERTKELERRNYELEQMNKAFVGRELRMVELKERIRELEKAANRV